MQFFFKFYVQTKTGFTKMPTGIYFYFLYITFCYMGTKDNCVEKSADK